MWLNSSYASERSALHHSDRVRSDRVRSDREHKEGDYAPVVEITMDRPLGFFNYFVERMRTYTDEYDKAKEIFERDRRDMTVY